MMAINLKVGMKFYLMENDAIFQGVEKIEYELISKTCYPNDLILKVKAFSNIFNSEIKNRLILDLTSKVLVL